MAFYGDGKHNENMEHSFDPNEEEYPLQDDYWPSRRWNLDRTKFIDLSGHNDDYTWIQWGETIAIGNQHGNLCYVNPHGKFDAGIPSEADRQKAKLIVKALNEFINKPNK